METKTPMQEWNPESNLDAAIKLIDHDHQHHSPVFHGFYSNHSMHAITALHFLGATDQTIKHWYKDYSKQLEPPMHLQKPNEPIELQNWQHHIGDWDYYPDFERFFKDMSKSMDLRKLINTFFPTLVPGMTCSALHPIITLGFGLWIDDPRSVINGMAYLAATYHAVDPGLAKLQFPSPVEGGESNTIWEALEELKNDKATFASLENTRGFQSRLKEISKDSEMLKVLRKQLKSVLSGLLSNEDKKSADELAILLGRVTMEVYFKAGCQDFFLLHGVTGFHALRRILLEIESEEEKMLILTYWVHSLMTVYVNRLCPSLDTFGKEELKEGAAPEIKFDSLIDTVRGYEDEHVIKLLWVAKWNWDKEVAKKTNLQELYKAAAMHTMRLVGKDGEGWNF